jgi:signal transduction histidine kinase
VVITTLYGGLLAGLIASVEAVLSLAFFFIEPLHSLKVSLITDSIQLCVFLLASFIVSQLIKERTARITAEARIAAADRFLKEIAHELNTPLASMVGWLNIIKLSQDPSHKAHALEVIERNVKLQTIIVNDILDMARFEAMRLVIKKIPVNINQVIDTAINIIQPLADDKGITIHHECLLNSQAVMIVGDERRLVQILWNLLTNAIKFTPQQGHIVIKDSKVHEWIQIKVIDNGMGIPADILTKIFQDRREKDLITASGLGIGLPLVKAIVMLHGGSIEASSEVGKGSQFTIKLPLAKPIS